MLAENASKSVFPSVDFFKLRPRLNRIKHLGLVSFYFSLFLLGTLPLAVTEKPTLAAVPGVALAIIALINLVLVKIRRLHDMAMSGYWLLLTPIPIVGQLLILFIFFYPGTPGANKFGEQPAKSANTDYLLLLATPIVIAVGLIILGPLHVS